MAQDITITTTNEIKSNDKIFGDEIVEIVRGFGTTDLKAIVKESGKTIEASLTNAAELFDTLAQAQAKVSLIKRGKACGLEEDVAEALAFRLITKKHPEQFNAQGGPVLTKREAMLLKRSVVHLLKGRKQDRRTNNRRYGKINTTMYTVANNVASAMRTKAKRNLTVFMFAAYTGSIGGYIGAIISITQALTQYPNNILSFFWFMSIVFMGLVSIFLTFFKKKIAKWLRKNCCRNFDKDSVWVVKDFADLIISVGMTGLNFNAGILGTMNRDVAQFCYIFSIVLVVCLLLYASVRLLNSCGCICPCYTPVDGEMKSEMNGEMNGEMNDENIINTILTTPPRTNTPVGTGNGNGSGNGNGTGNDNGNNGNGNNGNSNGTTGMGRTLTLELASPNASNPGGNVAGTTSVSNPTNGLSINAPPTNSNATSDGTMVFNLEKNATNEHGHKSKSKVQRNSKSSNSLDFFADAPSLSQKQSQKESQTESRTSETVDGTAYQDDILLKEWEATRPQ